jgi:hypothetical protein
MTKEELQRSVLLLGQHVRRLQEKLRAARSHDVKNLVKAAYFIFSY